MITGTLEDIIPVLQKELFDNLTGAYRNKTLKDFVKENDESEINEELQIYYFSVSNTYSSEDNVHICVSIQVTIPLTIIEEQLNNTTIH